MLVGIWRNDDLHLFPRWASALGSPHHACILATLLSFHRILSVVSLWWNHFCLNWEPLIKSFLKEIGTKRTLPPPGSSLPLSSPSRRPSRHWYCNKRKCWGVFFFLVVCVNEREWGLFIGWEEEWRALNVPCQRSMCLFTSALGSNSHKDGWWR